MDQAPSMVGKIYNTTTGQEWTITDSETFALNIPGLYTAAIKTVSSNGAGDEWNLEQSFRILSYDDAPSPHLNRDVLCSSVTIFDIEADYYAVPISAVGSEYSTYIITADYYDAYRIAFDYLKAIVVPNASDFTYKYMTVDYNSLSDLYRKIVEDARGMVIEFDPSAVTQIITIDSDSDWDELKDNSLFTDVYVVVDWDTSTVETPILSNDQHYTVNWSTNGLDLHTRQFAFMQYDGGVDSSSVTASQDGKTVIIEYGQDVIGQLEAAGFDSGMITITEETSYGKKTTYSVMLILK